MWISELALRCGYEYYGSDCEVDSIRYASAAEKNSIAIILKEQDINETIANSVIMLPAFTESDKTVMFSSDAIEFAAVRIAKELLGAKGMSLFQKTEYAKSQNYFLGKNVTIECGTIISPNVYIEDDVFIGKNCYIEPNVHIGYGTVIGDNVYIGCGSSIGEKSFYHYYDSCRLQEFPGIGKTIVNPNVSIGNNSTIQRGTFSDTLIGDGCKIGNLIDIGHDVTIGKNCKIVSQTGVASNVVIGDFVQIFGQAGIANNVIIGDNAVIYAKSLVTKNVPTGQKVSGMYAREHMEELKIQAKLHRL